MGRATIPVMLASLFAALAMLSGCVAAGSGSSKVITEKRDLAGFTGVDITGPFEAEIKRSDTFNVTITVQAKYVDYVMATKEGDTLKVSLSSRHVFTIFPTGTQTFRVSISMPALSRVSLSGATKGRITGFKSSRDLGMEISGASSLNMDGIEAGDVESLLSGATRLTGGLKAKDLRLNVSGASKVNLEGSADRLLLIVSGASDIDLLDFPLDQADVTLSGASEADLTVKTKLDLALADASRLYFEGNPAIGKMSITGASTIRHE